MGPTLEAPLGRSVVPGSIPFLLGNGFQRAPLCIMSQAVGSSAVATPGNLYIAILSSRMIHLLDILKFERSNVHGKV